MRLIDADALKTDIELQVAFLGVLSSELASIGKEVKKGFFDTIDRQKTIAAVPLEDYRSMEQTVNKLREVLGAFTPDSDITIPPHPVMGEWKYDADS